MTVTTLWAETALLADGWADAVRIDIADGRITAVEVGSAPIGARYGCLLPAPVNLHSHAFQRAMAGMTERRGASGSDSFWTWRTLMYRFLDHLSPDDVQAIAAFVQMEMLEAGYGAVAEFHYLHHQPGGAAYSDIAEMSARIVAAADQTGIGLTLLPVLYQQGGCDGRALTSGQARFGNDLDRFARLWDGAAQALRALPSDAVIGVAPHSLRAVTRDGLRMAEAIAPNAPIHIHLAEQMAEVEELKASYGARPTEWLLANTGVDARWCLIHATQMQPHETLGMAQTGAVAGLCPITEANLGDGIFDGARYLASGGRFGVGSDSNVRISLTEELRLLEYSQRLRDRGRAVLATPEYSTGRVLFEGAVQGGAQAGARTGALVVGGLADILALNTKATDLIGVKGDALLDTFIFAGDDRMVSDVWSAGRHMVQGGAHIARDAITNRYRTVMAMLRGRM